MILIQEIELLIGNPVNSSEWKSGFIRINRFMHRWRCLRKFIELLRSLALRMGNHKYEKESDFQNKVHLLRTSCVGTSWNDRHNGISLLPMLVDCIVWNSQKFKMSWFIYTFWATFLNSNHKIKILLDRDSKRRIWILAGQGTIQIANFLDLGILNSRRV